jgi:hypothetical protein
MIRTAILAGILLVMLSMAYSRPGALPSLTRAPAPAVSEQPAVEEAARVPASPRVETPREEPVPAVVAKKEEPAVVAAPEEPAVAEVTPEPVAPIVPVRETLPSAKVEPGRPLSLLPETQTAAPARDPSRYAPLVSENMPAPPAPVLPPAQAAKVEPVPAAELPEVHVATRPVMVPQDFASRLMPNNVTATEPPAAPQVAEARGPVIAPGTKFMTPEERSRELYRLAREMEDTFIQKLTQ